jgi:hypothetical protein
MNRDELFPVPNKPQRWVLALAAVCVLLSWAIVIGYGFEKRKGVQENRPVDWENSETIEPGIYDYSHLLKTYKQPDTNTSEDKEIYYGFILYLILHLALVAVILYLGKGCALYCLMLLIQGGFCAGIMMMNLGSESSGNYLYTEQTVTFDGRVYHVAGEKEWSTDPEWEKWSLFLFECDSTGERCSLLHRESYDYGPLDNSLEVNEASNQLEMYVNGALIYEIPPAP